MIDLRSQVQNTLGRLHGGTGRTNGAGSYQLVVPFLNDSGATLNVGDVVTRRAADPVFATSVTGDEKIIGVIVGRYSLTTGEFEAADPVANQMTAVCVVGVVEVKTDSLSARGDYLIPGPVGQATPTSTKQNGAFGYVLYTMSSSRAQALIGQMEGDAVVSGTGVPWFNVRNYGAVGNGSTDDTSAVNSAIAALVAAGGGVLYFPKGVYKTTGALTALSVPFLVLGDGSASLDDTERGSTVLCTSQTAVLFNCTSKVGRFESIGMTNTYAGTPSAGSAIKVAHASYSAQRIDFENISVHGFYVNVDVQVGYGWTMHACTIVSPVTYGVKIRNTVNVDAGDWQISDSNFWAIAYNATAAIRVESAGGGKIVNSKVNGYLVAYTTGIYVAIPTATSTVILLVANCSIENVSGDAIWVSTTGTGTYADVNVIGTEVGLYANNTGRAVKIDAASTGTGSGSIQGVLIDSCQFITDGTARAAVEIIKADNILLGEIIIRGFNARYTSSGGATNIVDSTSSSVTYATPAIVLGTAAAAGAAASVIRSDSTIVAFDATVPVTQAFSDAAATGAAAFAARRDHVHGMPAPGGIGEILIVDTPSTPLIFADLVQNDDQTDLVYADP